LETRRLKMDVYEAIEKGGPFAHTWKKATGIQLVTYKQILRNRNFWCTRSRHRMPEIASIPGRKSRYALRKEEV
jgi:hypothetical protein